jgi:integrase/recombinase XerD
MSDYTAPVDDLERAIIDLWRKGHLGSGTIQIYLHWVRRFRAFCEKRKLDEVEQLTREGVRHFVQRYAGPRLGNRVSAPSSRGVAHNALHAWSCSLQALGVATPPWRARNEPAPLPPLLGEYRQFRKAHCGVSDSTLRRDIDTAGAFLALLRNRRKPVERTCLRDVDIFVRRLI